MKIHIFLCNCRGQCEPFREAGAQPFAVGLHSEVELIVVHSTVCKLGGSTLFGALLSEALRHKRAYLVVSLCSPESQLQFFRRLLRDTGFDESRFVPVILCDADAETTLRQVKEAVDKLVRQVSPGSMSQAAS